MSNNSPYAAPKSSLLESSGSSENIYGFKKFVVQGENQIWPSRCYKCNEPTDNAKELKLYYINPWIYLTFLISPLILIIVSLIVRKKFVINLPVCENHLKRRKRFVVSQWVVSLVAIILIMMGGVYDLPFLIVASVLLFLYVVVAAIVIRMVYIAKLKDDRIWIRGANKHFIDGLPELPQ